MKPIEICKRIIKKGSINRVDIDEIKLSEMWNICESYIRLHEAFPSDEEIRNKMASLGAIPLTRPTKMYVKDVWKLIEWLRAQPAANKDSEGVIDE